MRLILEHIAQSESGQGTLGCTTLHTFCRSISARARPATALGVVGDSTRPPLLLTSAGGNRIVRRREYCATSPRKMMPSPMVGAIAHTWAFRAKHNPRPSFEPYSFLTVAGALMPDDCCQGRSHIQAEFLNGCITCPAAPALHAGSNAGA